MSQALKPTAKNWKWLYTLYEEQKAMYYLNADLLKIAYSSKSKHFCKCCSMNKYSEIRMFWVDLLYSEMIYCDNEILFTPIIAKGNSIFHLL